MWLLLKSRFPVRNSTIFLCIDVSPFIIAHSVVCTEDDFVCMPVSVGSMVPFRVSVLDNP